MRAARAAALIACVLGLGLAADRVRAGPLPSAPAFGAAARLRLPPGAVVRGQDAELEAVTCRRARSCIGVGSFRVASGDDYPMVATQIAGRWRRPVRLPFPSAGAGTPPGLQHAVLEAVSCPAAGACVAVGYFTDPAGEMRPMAIAQRHGAWGAPVQVRLPANPAPAGSGSSSLWAVSCAAVGDCEAVGYYIDAYGSYQGMTVADRGGTWAGGAELALPRDASAGPGGDSAMLWSVACPSRAGCEASGAYTNLAGATRPLVVADRRGAWGRARALALPRNGLTAVNPFQHSNLFSISCPALGDCEVVGEYADRNDNSQLLAIRERGGIWQRAQELAIPSGATSVSSGQDAYLEGLSCLRPSACVAVGTFTTRAGGQEPIALTMRRGVWSAPQLVALPRGAVASPQLAGLYSVGCWGSGSCVAVGAYRSRAGSEAMVAQLAPSPAGARARHQAIRSSR